jgi:hypothetical protein
VRKANSTKPKNAPPAMSFELFEDDDVLNMFDMTEPADAALAGHDPINHQLGVADQRSSPGSTPLAAQRRQATSEIGRYARRQLSLASTCRSRTRGLRRAAVRGGQADGIVR